MKFSLQFDYHGRFRIRLTVEEVSPEGSKMVLGVNYEEKTYTGKWTHYRGIALLTYQDKTYIASTMYGLLPQSEKVYQLGDIQETTLDGSLQYTDAQGKVHREKV